MPTSCQSIPAIHGTHNRCQTPHFGAAVAYGQGVDDVPGLEDVAARHLDEKRLRGYPTLVIRL